MDSIDTPEEKHLLHSDGIEKIAAALSKAQAEIGGAKKGSNNPFFKSNYADLASTWDACRAPLSENGLCVVQLPGHNNKGAPILTTKLVHTSGQWFQSVIELKAVKQDPQGQGSALTYARRYALQAMVGVAPVEKDAPKIVDDDGNAASGKRVQQPKQAPRPQQQPKAVAKPKPVNITKKDYDDFKNALTNYDYEEVHSLFLDTHPECKGHYQNLTPFLLDEFKVQVIRVLQPVKDAKEVQNNEAGASAPAN